MQKSVNALRKKTVSSVLKLSMCGCPENGMRASPNAEMKMYVKYKIQI